MGQDPRLLIGRVCELLRSGGQRHDPIAITGSVSVALKKWMICFAGFEQRAHEIHQILEPYLSVHFTSDVTLHRYSLLGTLTGFMITD